MAGSAHSTLAPAIPCGVPDDEREYKPLGHPSLSYDRAAIMRSAWREFRDPLNACEALERGVAMKGNRS